ncbi:MAG: glycosyl transferase family A [Desulfobulbus propionicus]|nr:MAG: glycosyl transferase family A [Desulfobulbus propionicus]
MISVIIPTHNRAGFLSRAVDSIACQTMLPDELVIVDDGSSDHTADVALQCRAKYDNRFLIRYIYQENAGAASARNTGIMTSRSSILCFLDSDDWWEPTKLERQFTAMREQPSYMISHTREIWYRQGKRVNQKKKHDPPHGNIFSKSLRMCMVGMSTVMLKKDCFDKFGLFDETFPCCEDYDLWLRMSCNIPFLLIKEQLINKDGGRPDQLSVIHRMGMDVYRIRSVEKLMASGCLTAEQQVLAARELSRKCTIYGRGCMKHGRPEEGSSYLEKAQKYDTIEKFPGAG